ncbi:hypothetical protein TV39_08815 [Arthrobacter sp. SPG23]|nr:hypothetical protein TV39_08815 [Arthrobacter sp. SPG23]
MQASNQMKKIPLYGRGSEGHFALVDDDVADLPYVRNYRWQFSDGRPSLGLGIVLARRIMQAPPHLEVDHINHDTSDNRRANLGLSTHAQNQANKRPQSLYGYKEYPSSTTAGSRRSGSMARLSPGTLPLCRGCCSCLRYRRHPIAG